MTVHTSPRPALRASGSARGRRRLALIGLSFFVLLAAVLSTAENRGYASVPSLGQIRVALFLDSGQSFRATAPAVTAAAAGGLSVSIRKPSGTTAWVAWSGAAPLRFSADQYRVQLLETPDYNLARAVQQSIPASAGTPFLYTRLKQGKAVYQAGLGPFATREAAQAALEQTLASGAAAAANTASALVTGPLYLSAGGPYATEAQARQQADAIAQQGIAAYPVATENAEGKPEYAVWVGGAADAKQLEATKAQALAASPALPLAPVPAGKPYLLLRSDLTDAATAADPVAHYSFNGTAEAAQQVWVAPAAAGESGIAVSEKAGRTYRGSLELSVRNGKLALINELPFEEYLYSVVSVEMGANFPAEALKAQAVAARTFALRQGMKYEIAHISDGSVDQVYSGLQAEAETVVEAVRATEGEVLVNKDGLILPFFHSNAGGMSGDAVEVWGQPIDYVASLPSPDDTAQRNKLPWYRVQFPDGEIGYVRSDFLRATGETNDAGLPVLVGEGSDVNVRAAPYVDNAANPPIRQINTGDRVVALEQVPESSSFSWIRGPFSAAKLLQSINASLDTPIAGPLTSLEVTKRGPSGRVTEIAVNGEPVPISRPDNYRGMLGGLPSTRFEIEETGRVPVIGADGTVRRVSAAGGSLYALSAGSEAPRQLAGGPWIALEAGGLARVVTQEQEYRFIGQGSGHGLGMSQWGAYGLAEAGYGYQQILQYYYQGVTVEKG